MPSGSFAIFVFSIFLLAAEPGAVSARTFTSTDGKTIEADVVSANATTVTLARKGQSAATIPIERLSADDQAYTKEWQIDQQKNRIPKVLVRVNSNKRDKKQQNMFEDREGEFEFDVYIENQERAFNIEGATATLMVLGKYFYKTEEGIVMERKEFADINIPDGGNTNLKGRLVKFEYDKSGYQHGQKYEGYLVVFRNAQGKVIDISGSSQRVESQSETILKLKEGERFDEGSFRSLSDAPTVVR